MDQLGRNYRAAVSQGGQMTKEHSESQSQATNQAEQEQQRPRAQVQTEYQQPYAPVPPPRPVGSEQIDNAVDGFQRMNLGRGPPPPPPPRPALDGKLITPADEMRTSYHVRGPPRQQEQGPTPAPQRTQPSPASAPVARPRPVTPQPHTCGVTPITECCDGVITYPIDWFTHRSAPEFTICSRCYVDVVYESPFRNEFSSSRPDNAAPRLCMFAAPRFKEYLWPRAVSSRTLGEMLPAMQVRETLQACPEKTLQENRARYTCPEIAGAAICEACFEGHLAHTPFASRFRREAGDAQQWYCDFSSFFLRRQVAHHARTGNWAQLLAEFNARLAMPECPKLVLTLIDQRTWFISRRGPDGMQMCQACLVDYFAGTPVEADFVRGQPTGVNGTAICVMGHLNLLLLAMHTSAIKDWDLFWSAAHRVASNPICMRDGTTTNTVWYTVKNDPAGFAVCAACMAGIVNPLGGARHFMLKPGTTKGTTMMCSFSTGALRWQQFLQAFSQTLTLGKMEPLATCAATYGNVPLCPRDDLKKHGNRKWWGWENLHVCEECYVSYAKGTKLEPQFALKGQFREKPQICDLYSPRMRALYEEACQSPQELNALLEFARQRRQIFNETIPKCEEILMAQFMKAQHAKLMMATGGFYKAMGGAQAAISGYDHTVGNAAVGYGWKNDTEFTGAVYDHQGMQLAGEVGNGGPTAMIGLLEKRWKQVE